MKLYIRATQENHTLFSDTTDTSYYDNFLKESGLEYMQDSKNLTGEIVMMTPDEYFQSCAKIFNTSVSKLVNQRSDSLLPKYVQAMRDGDVFPLCYIDYANDTQEGLHRMLAAKQAFGADIKYPVLVVSIYDKEVYDNWRLSQDARDFELYEFDKYIDKAVDKLRDWSASVPDNIEDLMTSEIEAAAKQNGYDIEVDCEIDKYGDDPTRLCVYLVKYGDYLIPVGRKADASPYLQDMFDYDD